jgi:hypothetical protein
VKGKTESPIISTTVLWREWLDDCGCPLNVEVKCQQFGWWGFAFWVCVSSVGRRIRNTLFVMSGVLQKPTTEVKEQEWERELREEDKRLRR